jgi:hypothetical protein
MAHSRRQTLRRQGIFYPDTDGEPMAESDFQRKPLTYLVEALDLHFQERSNVYVSGNLLVYYEEGNPNASVAPTCSLCLGFLNATVMSIKSGWKGKGRMS